MTFILISKPKVEELKTTEIAIFSIAKYFDLINDGKLKDSYVFMFYDREFSPIFCISCGSEIFSFNNLKTIMIACLSNHKDYNSKFSFETMEGYTQFELELNRMLVANEINFGSEPIALFKFNNSDILKLDRISTSYSNGTIQYNLNIDKGYMNSLKSILDNTNS
jgi:hypothetical protein